MKTLKFVRYNDEGCFEDIVECQHYTVYTRKNNEVTVTTYKDHLNVEGVDRHIGTHKNGYDVCFVMNDSGKTVDTIKYKVTKGRVTVDCDSKELRKLREEVVQTLEYEIKMKGEQGLRNLQY